MATVTTDVAASQTSATTNIASRVVDAGQVSGNLLICNATYTLLGTESASDVINIIQLPEGARVVPHLCQVYAENPGTALTIKFGDAADDDRYSTAVALGAGGNFSFSNEITGPNANYKVGGDATDDRWIKGTLTAATTLTADQVVTFQIAYALVS